LLKRKIQISLLENVSNIISMENLVKNEFDILKKLDKIDINKSPGPD